MTMDWLQCIGRSRAGQGNEGVDHHGRSESSASLRGGVQAANRAVVRERQAVVADQGGVRHPALHAAALGAGDTQQRINGVIASYKNWIYRICLPWLFH